MPGVGERDPNRVIVFDTTLRDGEQAPGFSMSVEAKLEMARALRDLGVDVIEAGFAAASPGDADAVEVEVGPDPERRPGGVRPLDDPPDGAPWVPRRPDHQRAARCLDLAAAAGLERGQVLDHEQPGGREGDLRQALDRLP